MRVLTRLASSTVNINMARTKQKASKSTGGKAPIKDLHGKAARKSKKVPRRASTPTTRPRR